MKRIPALLSLFLISMSFLAAVNLDSKTLNISAYKDEPVPVCRITVSSAASQSFSYSYVSGSTGNSSGGVYDITGMAKANNGNVDDALIIQMSTNRRNPGLVVKLTLEPFKAQTTGDGIKESAKTVYRIRYVSSSLDAYYDNLKYTYTLSLMSDAFSNNQAFELGPINGVASKTIELTGRMKSSKAYPYSGITLPGIGDQAVSAVCKIDIRSIAIDDKTGNYFTSNVDYVANIKIEITTAN